MPGLFRCLLRRRHIQKVGSPLPGPAFERPILRVVQTLVLEVEGGLDACPTVRLQPLVYENDSIGAGGKSQLVDTSSSRVEAVISEALLEFGIAENDLPDAPIALILEVADNERRASIPAAFLLKGVARHTLDGPITHEASQPCFYSRRMSARDGRRNLRGRGEEESGR